MNIKFFFKKNFNFYLFAFLLFILAVPITLFGWNVTGGVNSFGASLSLASNKYGSIATNNPTSTPTIHYYSLIYNKYGIARPVGIAIDANGDIWVASTKGLTELNSSGAIINTASEIYYFPYTVGSVLDNIAIDANGNIYTISYDSDFGKKRINKYNSSITTLISNIPYSSSCFAIGPKGNIWNANSNSRFAPYSHGAFYKFNSNGIKKSLTYYKNGNTTYSIAIDANGNVWLANANGTIIIINHLNPHAGYVINYKNKTGDIPYDIAIGKNGNVWVSNYGVGTITELTYSGAVKNTYAVGRNASNAKSIAIDANGNVWVVYQNADNKDGMVAELNYRNGDIMNTYTLKRNFDPNRIAIDANGNVWVTGYNAGEIAKISSAAKGPQYFPYSGPQYPY